MPLLTGEQEMSPSARRSFGGVLAGVLCLLAYMLSGLSISLAWMLVASGIIWLTIFYGVPAWQPALIRFWRWLTWPLAWLVGHVLLASVYFGVLLPLGLWRRSHDPLQLQHSDLDSGWKARRQKNDDQEYFRQF